MGQVRIRHMFRPLRVALGGLGFTLLVGCAPIGPLLNRAAFDLDCTRNKLSVVDLDTNTKGVQGCGRRATYIWSCGAKQICVWVLNSPGK
jgi:hypothetical protein